LALAALGGAACAPIEGAAPKPVAAAPPPPASSGPTVPPRPETPDAPFRQTPPPEDGPLVFAPPKIESFRLKNGIRVLLVERHDLPLTSVGVTMRAGAGDFPNIGPGVASFTASMLEQGTTSRDAIQISDQYEEIGARHGVSAGVDSTSASVAVLTRHLDRGLAILSDVLQHPSFPEAEIDRLRARRLGGLTAEKHSPEAIVGNATTAAVYGRAHPYGHTLLGRPDEVKKITRDDLTRAYASLFSPKNASIIVAGDATRASITPLLERAFGSWKAAPGAAAPHAVPPAPAGGPRLVWVDRPGSAQSQVRVVVDVALPEGSPDRMPVAVMNAVLGGGLTARLSMNLREAHGYTYGAYSGVSHRRGPGMFSASSGVQSQSTAPAIKEIFHEIGRMRDEEVKAAELADAKEQVRRGHQTPFETLGGVVAALSTIAVYERPLDDYATLPKKIDAVTAADVRRVATKYLRPDAIKVIVVGDRTKLDAAVLEPLKLGPPDLRDEYGDPVGR
jgi:predicted Zn-dependent peptidase